MSSSPEPRRAPPALVILASGRGSNLQAILDAAARGDLPVTIRAVVSDRPGAQALDRAARSGIAAVVVDPAGCDDRAAFDRALLDRVVSLAPDLVVLAGYMRILAPDFVRTFSGRLLNIHPSLLPAFPGLNTHRRALEAGVAEHGASVHFVTDELDGGPVILRGRVAVRHDDDPATLAARVLEVEHRMYPLAIRWFAEGRLRQQAGRVLFDGRPLATPLDFAEAGDSGDASADHDTTPPG